MSKYRTPTFAYASYENAYAFRIEEVLVDSGDPERPDIHCYVLWLKVLSFTPKGFWVRDATEGRKRFILEASRKKYAHWSMATALESFKRRKLKQEKILKVRLRRAALAVAAASRLKQENFLGGVVPWGSIAELKGAELLELETTAEEENATRRRT